MTNWNEVDAMVRAVAALQPGWWVFEVKWAHGGLPCYTITWTRGPGLAWATLTDPALGAEWVAAEMGRLQAREAEPQCIHHWIEFSRHNDYCPLCKAFRLREWESEAEYAERKAREAEVAPDVHLA